MNSIRKEFFKRLAYLVLGIIPLFFLLHEKGPLRFIVGAGVLFSVFQFIMILAIAQMVIDDFFPPKTYRKSKAGSFDSFVYRFSAIFFIVTLILLMFEITTIDNTLGGLRLFWISGFAGVLLAIVVIILLKIKSPTLYHEGRRRATVIFGLVLGFFMLTPASASFVNHTFRTETISCQEYKINRKSIGGRRLRKTSLLFLTVNGHEERFKVSDELWNDVTEGGPVILCTQKDFWVMSSYRNSKPRNQ